MEHLEAAICEVAACLARKFAENVTARVAEFANGAPVSDDIICAALVRNNN